MSPMIPKDQKIYNLHHDDVRGDVLRPPHGTTPAAVKIISIFHGCMVWMEKSVTRVTDRHHEACRVMPNSDPE